MLSVCSLPHSQSTVSVLYPHLHRFFFVQATPTLNLLNVFHVFHSQRYPGGSFSTGFILKLLVWFDAIHFRCRSYSSDVVISVVDFKKFFLDFNPLGAG